MAIKPALPADNVTVTLQLIPNTSLQASIPANASVGKAAPEPVAQHAPAPLLEEKEEEPQPAIPAMLEEDRGAIGVPTPVLEEEKKQQSAVPAVLEDAHALLQRLEEERKAHGAIKVELEEERRQHQQTNKALEEERVAHHGAVVARRLAREDHRAAASELDEKRAALEEAKKALEEQRQATKIEMGKQRQRYDHQGAG